MSLHPPHSHKLVKRMSAVSFQENATVYEPISDNNALKSNNNINNSISNGSEQTFKFRTILKKTMPKIKCISKFSALHENVQHNNLEKAVIQEDSGCQTESKTSSYTNKLIIQEDFDCQTELKASSYKKKLTLQENYDSQTESKQSSISSKLSRPRRSIRRSKSAASSRESLSSCTRINSANIELVQSFINSVPFKENKKKEKNKSNNSFKRKKKKVLVDPIFIYTKDRLENDSCNTDEALECQKLFQILQANGVRISLTTLKRGLLPPSATRIERYEFNQSTLPYNSCSGLLNHPSTWLPKEYARLKSAKKRMEQFEEETIRQSTVVTSDDESLSSEEGRNRQSHSKLSQYNEFARSMSKASISPVELKSKKSIIFTKAKAVYKFQRAIRPKTAG